MAGPLVFCLALGGFLLLVRLRDTFIIFLIIKIT